MRFNSTTGYYYQVITAAELPLHPTAHRVGKSWCVKRANYVWNLAHPDNPVQKGELIHHRNHDKTDDSLANLEKMTEYEHRSHHARESNGGGRYQAAKTHCKRGHAYDEANTYFYRGSRNCRACCKEKMARRRATTTSR